MKELQSVLAAILYVLAQFCVIVLKPVLLVCSKASEACAKIAQNKLAQLHKKPQVDEPACGD